MTATSTEDVATNEQGATLLSRIEQELRQRRLSILDAPILVALEEHSVSLPQIKRWAEDFYTSIYHGSPTSLGNFYANSPDDPQLRAELTKNVFEEETGRISGIGRRHMDVFVDLLEHFGHTTESVRALTSPVGDLSPHGRPIPAEAYYLELATFLILGEGPNAEFSQRVAAALVDGYGLPAEAVVWFTLHAQLDKDHADELPRYVQRALERDSGERLTALVLEIAPLVQLAFNGYGRWSGD
jgi:pyrroloquinoline quinone (PQQ) biosynthesis protein C